MSHRIPISEFIVRLREEGLLTMWQGDPDLVIEDIQYDSRKCTANSLFLCNHQGGRGWRCGLSCRAPL